MSDPYRRASYQTNRKIVLALSGGHCCVPGCTRLATTADHRIPLAEGGTNELGNLQAMCHHHNCSGGAKLANQKRAARKLGRRSRGW